MSTCLTKVYKLFLTFLFSQALSVQAAMVIRDYDPARHDRFYSGVDKAFIADDYDLSGVGRSGEHWATMISDSYFLSANHYHPGVGSSVTFWESNNFAGPNHSYTVASGQRVGSTDLWVGRLAATAAASIARYAIPVFPSEISYLGQTLYNYGKDHRVGRNVSDGIVTISTGGSTGRTLVYDYDNNDVPSVGGDETFLQGGDSGSSTFIARDSELFLTGIHWAITNEFPGFEGEFSVDSFVPRYINDINALLANGGESLSLHLIPEPSAILPAALFITALMCRRRRG
ncbi:MAG: hypothetical protein ACPGSB_06070 [Opitutales bacterium]